MYGTCITHTGAFGSDANSLIGWSGMIIGGGEILGKFDSKKKVIFYLSFVVMWSFAVVRT
mgnify:CR=1 FL=1